jgi:non-ribosomal peptide synthetase component F
LGIPIVGRPHADLHHIVGMFVNTMAIRNRPRRNKTFREFLNEVKERTLLAFENQDYQFEDLVNALSFTPDPGRNPVFDVMFILQNVEADAAYIPGIEKEATTEKTRLSMKTYPYKNPVSKFDMILTAVEPPNGKSIGMMLEYVTRLFKQETIEQFVGYYLEIVRAVTKDKNIRLEDITVSHGLKQVKSYNPEMDLGF